MIKKIKVCSSVYDVEYSEKAIIDNGSKILFGNIEHGEMKVNVSGIYPYTKQLQTIHHECIHAIEVEYDIEIPESIVERLSNAFYSLIIDNPQFIKEILEDDLKNREDL